MCFCIATNLSSVVCFICISLISHLTLVSISFSKVNSLEKELTEWRLKLKQLHTDYDKLLFFHIPKMLRMFKMLYRGSSVLENVPQLVQEVSFLFDSTVETREHITATLQVRVLVCTYVCVCMCASACVCVCLCVHILLHVPCPIHLRTSLTSIC